MCYVRLRSFIAIFIVGSAIFAATAVPVESGARPIRHNLAPRSVPTPSSCTKNYAGASFVGVAEENVAGGINSAVLGGEFNTACDNQDAIAGGGFNDIGFSGGARSSFIGGGSSNGVTGNTGFIGAGQLNYVAATSAGVGSGALNAATSGGAFVGAGGLAFYDNNQGKSVGYGNIASGLDSFVGAGDLNQVAGSGSFIGAGGYAFAMSGATTAGNAISGNDSFIGAGDQNKENGNWSAIVAGQGSSGYGNYSVIGGGYGNVVGTSGDAGEYGVIAGGEANTVMGVLGTVSGGDHNNATGRDSVVSGGSLSSATGSNATIAGGYLNAANGIGSFAAGTQAKARNDGAFVWSDNSSSNELQSTAPYQFWARAAGGFFLVSNSKGTAGVKLLPGAGAWSNLSDRAMKTGVVALDDSAVLAKVAALPVSEWSYTSERGVRHVGPMAQDFYAAFRVGEDDRHITSIDEDGVALAAIKALDEQNAALRARLSLSDARLAALERKVEALARRAP
jgi:hypothetical protein